MSWIIVRSEDHWWMIQLVVAEQMMWPNLCQPANVRVPVLTCGLYLMYSVFSAVLYVIFYPMTCPPAYMGFNPNQVVGSPHHLGTID